jgi:hypothetical protein
VVFALAFYTKDAAQIDRLFRASGVMQGKWDELRGTRTCGEFTIAKALETVAQGLGENAPTSTSAGGKGRLDGQDEARGLQERMASC